MTLANYQGIDPNLPSSLNRDIVTSVLRNQLGHKGLIITDDIGIMDAVRGKYSLLDATVMAIKAGNDAVIIGNSKKSSGRWTHNINFSSSSEQLRFTQQICDRAQTDDLLMQEINESFLRILHNKQVYGIIADEVPMIRDSLSADDARAFLEGVATAPSKDLRTGPIVPGYGLQN